MPAVSPTEAMTFSLSTVMAFMCGVEVTELQLRLLVPDAADDHVEEPVVNLNASLMLETTPKKVDETARSRPPPTVAANANKPSKSAEWFWRVRREFASHVLSKKELITAPPPAPPAQPASAAMSSSSSSRRNVSNTNSLPTTSLSRPESVLLTEVVAQALPCLCCAPPTNASTAPTSTMYAGTATITASASLPASASPPEQAIWGVPQWPGCTITLGEVSDALWKRDEEKVLSDIEGDGAPENLDAFNVLIRWSTSPAARNATFATSAPMSQDSLGGGLVTTTTLTAEDLERLVDGGGTAETDDAFAFPSPSPSPPPPQPPQLVVRVCGASSAAEFTAAPSHFDAYLRGDSERSGDVIAFCDPMPSVHAPLPSRVLPPPSLLLPDAVCVRVVPPPPPPPPAAVRSAAARVSAATAAAMNSNGPTVEVLLIAVEALPELQEVRRRGLMLYKELLLRQYANRKADNLARRHDSGAFLFGNPTLPELPSLQWQCELWTPLPEGGRTSATTTTATPGAGLVRRAVVQAGVFASYAPNKSSVSPPSKPVAVGPLGAAAATPSPPPPPSPPPSPPRWPRAANYRPGTLKKYSRASSPLLSSPLMPSPLADLEVELRTFYLWWLDMAQLTRKLEQRLLPSAPPLTPPPTTTALKAATAAPEPERRQQQRQLMVETTETTARLRSHVELLLHWWAAKSVRLVSFAALRPTSPLPPLPSGASPLFGAVVVPAYVRAAPAPATRPVQVLSPTGSDDVGSGPVPRTAAAVELNSPPAMSALPALTLCFVNPRGAYVHQYDLEALNVLCRAVHSLHAAVCVFDAAQKAALLRWMKCFVKPYAPPAETTTVPAVASPTPATGTPAVAAQASSAPASSTGAAVVSTQGEGESRLVFPFDALAEVERNCLCLEDYVFERHRQALADDEKDVKDDHKTTESGGTSLTLSPPLPPTSIPGASSTVRPALVTAGASASAAAAAVSPSAAALLPPSPSLLLSGIVEKARTGAVPTRSWCRDARVLACSDFLGRRRLDVFTGPIKHAVTAALPVATASAATATAPHAVINSNKPDLSMISSATTRAPPPPPLAAPAAPAADSSPSAPTSPPALLLNSVPPSFLSYLLTRIGDHGVEEVEQLSGTIMTMGRRLSGN